MIFLFLLEEPEEEVSFEDLEERAKSGDAKAQTKVSVTEHIVNIIDFNSHMLGTKPIDQLMFFQGDIERKDVPLA